MFNVKNIGDALVKLLLFALVALIFLTTTVAFGNVVFGIMASALYIYEVARI